MKIFVITKKTLYIAAAVLAGLILAVVLILTLSKGNGAEAGERERRTEVVGERPSVIAAPTQIADKSAALSVSAASLTKNGLLSSEDEYEAEVLAGFKKGFGRFRSACAMPRRCFIPLEKPLMRCFSF